MNYDIFASEILQISRIVLDTTYILGTSKNIETIKGRYKLLIEPYDVGYDSLFDKLRNSQNNPNYQTFVQNAIDEYQIISPDKHIHDYQKRILLNPNNFDLNTFYCIALVNAMLKYTDEQIEEIKAMKSEGAKIKRIEKAQEIINITRTELISRCPTNKKLESALLGLQELNDSLKSIL